LALLIGGGFLISQNVENVSATDAVVISDDFQRANGAPGNGWTTGTPNDWSIINNQLVSKSGASYKNPLLRSDTFQNGKVTVYASTNDNDATTKWLAAVARYGNYDDGVGYYTVLVNPSLNQCRFRKFVAGEAQTLSNGGCDGAYTGGEFHFDFIVSSTSPSSTRLELVLYDADNEQLTSLSVDDTTPNLQSTGQWGLTAHGIRYFDSVEITSNNDPPAPVDFNITTDKQNIKLGESITISISDDEAQTATLSDGGRGGTFSTTDVDLNVSNNFAQTITYTPSVAGQATITADLGGGTTYLTDIFASPYSLKIGFIGSSTVHGVANNGSGNITANPKATDAAMTDLGDGFSAVNKGVSGSTTTTWLNNSYLTTAISDFTAQGVEVVEIMLGTNDSYVNTDGTYNGGTTPAEYKVNTQTIIDQLLASGVKKIILNESQYVNRDTSTYANANTNILAYRQVLDELADGRDVLRGSTNTYDTFKNDLSLTSGDGVHPTSPVGHETLGQLWADVYNDLLIAPYGEPQHAFNGGSSYTVGSDVDLVHRSAVDLRAFGHFVTVDGAALTEGSDYTFASGSTEITLASGYLDSLSVGTHTLAVSFLGVSGSYGAVSLANTFNILAKSTGGNSGGGNGLASPNTGSNLGKLLKDNRSAVLAIITVVIAGLGISIALVSRKLAKES
jgi:hypothetical protein